jgi:hypothetical protein
MPTNHFRKNCQNSIRKSENQEDTKFHYDSKAGQEGGLNGNIFWKRLVSRVISRLSIKKAGTCPAFGN